MIISHGKYDEIIPINDGKLASDWFSENKIRNKFIETKSAHGISIEDFKILSHWIDEN
jgi:predicted esterase